MLPMPKSILPVGRLSSRFQEGLEFGAYAFE